MKLFGIKCPFGNKLTIMLFILLNLVTNNIIGQTQPLRQSIPYSQTFDSLLHSSTSYPIGWIGWQIGSSSSTSYSTLSPIADRLLNANASASTSSGNIHNYNGKLGILNTNSLDLGIALALNSSNKKNISISYDVMTIRNPYDTSSNTRIRELALQYRIDSTSSFKTILSSAYQNNTIKQIKSGITTAQNLQNKTIILPSECDSQSYIQVRWATRDVSGSGNRPSFAIDNINVDTASVMDLIFVNDMTENKSTLPGQIQVNLSSPLKHLDSFKYSISGSGILGIDYTAQLNYKSSTITLSATSGYIKIDTGAYSFLINFYPINDMLVEGMEDILFTIENPLKTYALKDSTLRIRIIDDEITPIHLIQTNKANAKTGKYNVEAIVTGVYPEVSPKGFYIQEKDTDKDADINTSEALFVVSNTKLDIGDKVLILGEVYEHNSYPSYNQAIIIPDTLTVVSKGNPMPLPLNIILPLDSVQSLEKYEGMYVQFKDTLTVSDHSNLSQHGELTLSKGGVIYQTTQLIDPNDIHSSGTNAYGKDNILAIDSFSRSNVLRSILLDDGKSTTLSSIPYINSDNTIRIGSTIDSLKGIMAYAFDQYRIYPLSLSDVHINYQSRPSVPDVGSSANIKVASMNVLNYFNGDGIGGGFPTSRGAMSLKEFTRQRDKIINALLLIDADIFGLIELQNNGSGSSSAIQNIVNGLNAYKGSAVYSIVEDGINTQYYNTDEIRCGIIYKNAILDTVGKAILCSDSIFNRPPLAQKFKVKSSDSSFIFVINHLKSKGCSGSKLLDKDQGDGQSCFNDRRKAQASSLFNFVSTQLEPLAQNILLMGDFNSYWQEDPLDTLRNLGLHILGDSSHFSYFYQGAIGSLDNAIANSSLLPFVTGVAKWNINSSEPEYLNYKDDINDGSGDRINYWSYLYKDDPYRSSDHDPVIVGLNLGNKLSVTSTPASLFEISIFPNPSSDVLNIKVSSNSLENEIIVLNNLGVIISKQNVTQNEIKLDISHLPIGTYNISVINRAISRTMKFIKY